MRRRTTGIAAKALERETAISGEELQQRKSLVDVAAARYESALHDVNQSIALLGVRRADLALARQVLQDAEIRAPFAGVVEQRYAAPGAYVQVGQPIVMLDKVDPWRFRASVPGTRSDGRAARPTREHSHRRGAARVGCGDCPHQPVYRHEQPFA